LLEPRALLNETTEGGKARAGADHDDRLGVHTRQLKVGLANENGHTVRLEVAVVHRQEVVGAYALANALCGRNVIRDDSGDVDRLGFDLDEL